MPSFLSPLLRGSAQGYTLRNMRNGMVVAYTLLPAFDSKSRNRGLLRHDHLPEGTALILAPTSAIHTFFMKFSIDVLFVAKDGRVLKVRQNLAPWRLSGAWGGYAVIELRSGDASIGNVDRGDVLSLVR